MSNVAESEPPGRTTGRILARSSPKSSDAQLRLARAHPVDVAPQGVDLAVAGDHPVRMRELPAREGVRRIAGERGGTPYNRIQGDTAHKPNPCVAPIVAKPFYAVKIVAGSLGTFAGLRTDEHARVLDSNARAIAGLYAVGNDMASIMAGLVTPRAGSRSAPP